MHIINHKDNIRLVSNYRKVRINGIAKVYKVQIKVLWLWATIKSFDEDDYADACDCFRYCTNPYKY